ncbi:hypothetical protein PZ739_10815 [Pseudomonas kermanshahensis]|uniref:hypothetical protein n=1 Tax=Pseudomonas kermanshahensis TaxID=2745482 RepID=UPI0023DCC7AB|nr:hypothetical protein [Pseudomonas kermanshahensis]WEL57613.1 hypothetical protein PZ739_10815 [Pseudomonas kermanshahensis]
MDDGLKVYWDALSRMEEGIPLIVSPDAEINYDTVALEAGRSRGSLKASRPQHANIRDAIERAAKEINDARSAGVPVSKAELKRKIKAERERAESFKALSDQILAREIMLLRHVAKLEKEIDRLEGLRIVKFQKK